MCMTGSTSVITEVKILSRVHENFRHQSGVLETCIIVINYYIIYYNYTFYCYCKTLLEGEREKRLFKSFLESLLGSQ